MMKFGESFDYFKVLTRAWLGFVNYEAWGLTVPWIL